MRASAGVRVVALAALACSACESKGDVRRAQLLTTADFEALLNDPTAPPTIVDGYGLPGGMRLDRIITRDANGKPVLVKRDTYTHGYKSAYLTTEVWAGFDEVWVQPVYVAVTGYPHDLPPPRQKGKSGNWRPIFGVGPDSAFYSPFWETIYFVADTDDIDSIQSVKDVFAHGSDFRPAEGRVMAIAPTTVGVPPRLLETKNDEPLTGGPKTGDKGVYDGVDMPFLDFGTNSFDWDPTERVVEEVPLFVWVLRDANGELQQLDMPTVGGSGPLYSNREARVDASGKPKYGSYWRIYTVEMQPGWRVYLPQFFDEDRKRLGESNKYLYEEVLYTGVQNTTDPIEVRSFDDYAGRVLTNPVCVKDDQAINPSNATNDPPPDPICVYVDSQAKIEALVPPNAIHRTDIVVTCPFITYNFLPVVLP